MSLSQGRFHRARTEGNPFFPASRGHGRLGSHDSTASTDHSVGLGRDPHLRRSSSGVPPREATASDLQDVISGVSSETVSVSAPGGSSSHLLAHRSLSGTAASVPPALMEARTREQSPELHVEVSSSPTPMVTHSTRARREDPHQEARGRDAKVSVTRRKEVGDVSRSGRASARSSAAASRTSSVGAASGYPTPRSASRTSADPRPRFDASVAPSRSRQQTPVRATTASRHAARPRADKQVPSAAGSSSSQAHRTASSTANVSLVNSRAPSSTTSSQGPSRSHSAVRSGAANRRPSTASQSAAHREKDSHKRDRESVAQVPKAFPPSDVRPEHCDPAGSVMEYLTSVHYPIEEAAASNVDPVPALRAVTSMRNQYPAPPPHRDFSVERNHVPEPEDHVEGRVTSTRSRSASASSHHGPPAPVPQASVLVDHTSTPQEAAVAGSAPQQEESGHFPSVQERDPFGPRMTSMRIQPSQHSAGPGFPRGVVRGRASSLTAHASSMERDHHSNNISLATPPMAAPPEFHHSNRAALPSSVSHQARCDSVTSHGTALAAQGDQAGGAKENDPTRSGVVGGSGGAAGLTMLQNLQRRVEHDPAMRVDPSSRQNIMEALVDYDKVLAQRIEAVAALCGETTAPAGSEAPPRILTPHTAPNAQRSTTSPARLPPRRKLSPTASPPSRGAIVADQTNLTADASDTTAGLTCQPQAAAGFSHGDGLDAQPSSRTASGEAFKSAELEIRAMFQSLRFTHSKDVADADAQRRFAERRQELSAQRDREAALEEDAARKRALRRTQSATFTETRAMSTRGALPARSAAPHATPSHGPGDGIGMPSRSPSGFFSPSNESFYAGNPTPRSVPLQAPPQEVNAGLVSPLALASPAIENVSFLRSPVALGTPPSGPVSPMRSDPPELKTEVETHHRTSTIPSVPTATTSRQPSMYAGAIVPPAALRKMNPDSAPDGAPQLPQAPTLSSASHATVLPFAQSAESEQRSGEHGQVPASSVVEPAALLEHLEAPQNGSVAATAIASHPASSLRSLPTAPSPAPDGSAFSPHPKPVLGAPGSQTFGAAQDSLNDAMGFQDGRHADLTHLPSQLRLLGGSPPHNASFLLGGSIGAGANLTAAGPSAGRPPASPRPQTTIGRGSLPPSPRSPRSPKSNPVCEIRKKVGKGTAPRTGEPSLTADEVDRRKDAALRRQAVLRATFEKAVRQDARHASARATKSLAIDAGTASAPDLAAARHAAELKKAQREMDSDASPVSNVSFPFLLTESFASVTDVGAALSFAARGGGSGGLLSGSQANDDGAQDDASALEEKAEGQQDDSVSIPCTCCECAALWREAMVASNATRSSELSFQAAPPTPSSTSGLGTSQGGGADRAAAGTAANTGGGLTKTEEAALASLGALRTTVARMFLKAMRECDELCRRCKTDMGASYVATVRGHCANAVRQSTSGVLHSSAAAKIALAESTAAALSAQERALTLGYTCRSSAGASHHGVPHSDLLSAPVEMTRSEKDQRRRGAVDCLLAAHAAAVVSAEAHASSAAGADGAQRIVDLIEACHAAEAAGVPATELPN